MRDKLKDNIFGWCYILPSFVLIMFFSIIPIFMNVYYSFTDYNVMQDPTWVGLANFERMVNDHFVTDAIINTFVFTAITVPLQTISSLVIAALIAGFFRKRFGGFLRSSMFIPVISSAVLIGSIWLYLLAPSGVVNQFLGVFGIDPVIWLGSQDTALLSVSLVTVWKNVGYFLVMYYAGIMDIPKEYYEAAQIDGATPIQQFFRITIPRLKPISYLVISLGTIWSFQVFDMVQVMTGGGPGTSTVTLVLNIYKAAFREFNMGYASAIALLLFVFVMFINAIQRFIFRGEED